MRAHTISPAARPPAFDYRLPTACGSLRESNAGDEGEDTSRTIQGAVLMMRAGRTSSRELVERSLAVVEQSNAELNALCHLDADSALQRADDCDRAAAGGDWVGPLHGVPLTVKDVIDVAGMPTRAGSDAFESHPGQDAVAVARLRQAGAIILGKATTHEFALGVTSPQSRNPYDPTRIPGGSSGGSAIAVATGMGLGSVGTDTRASIRVPAALCGTVGLKPTFGSVPTRGIVPLSWTMDHICPMATTVGDAALLLQVMARRTIGAGSLPATRVGVPPSAFEDTDEKVATCVRDALDRLPELGVLVAPAPRPLLADLELANAAGLLTSRCEAAAYHRSLDLDRSVYWEEVADQLSAAADVRAIDYIDAQRVRAELTEQMTSIFADFDVIAMPTVAVLAPPVGDFSRYLLRLSRNAIVWSFTGLPALSVPCGLVDGLPVGIQLVTAPWREDRLIALGTALQQALGGGRPAVLPGNRLK